MKRTGPGTCINLIAILEQFDSTAYVRLAHFFGTGKDKSLPEVSSVVVSTSVVALVVSSSIAKLTATSSQRGAKFKFQNN